MEVWFRTSNLASGLSISENLKCPMLILGFEGLGIKLIFISLYIQVFFLLSLTRI